MHQFRAAQPALLYLSPACILSVTFTALLRGEFQAFWHYADEDEEAKTKEREDSAQKLESTTTRKGEANGHDTDIAKSTSIDAHSDGPVKRK